MAIEIERKFLVDKEKWKAFSKPTGMPFHQGYILTDPNKTIRVRLTDAKAFLTIKGKNEGPSRIEFEYEIPKEDATTLLNNFAVSELNKIRYEIFFEGKLWEVDEFLGDNFGLVVAEIELNSEDEKFVLPDWITKEVTGEDKYYNSNLTLTPYLKW